MDTSESVESPIVHECGQCQQSGIASLAKISSSSLVDVEIGDLLEWKNGHEPSCALCKLIGSVIEDASQRFDFVQERPASLKLIPKDQYTLLGLKFKERRDAYTEDVDSIFIYREPESKSPRGLCSYKRIPRNKDSDVCFEAFKEWIRDCRENHRACRLPCATSFPTRVLDIQGPDARLAENLTTEDNYVALSHCWGKEEFIKTEKSTFQSHKKCIELQSMPQNFKDAIHVCRALGYKYLWIDSLCIIQDDEQDWVEQSDLMEGIYHNADLVIAATCAPNAMSGFLTESRPSYREGTVSISLQDTDNPTTFWYRLIPPHRCREGPLDDRGWAFQERLRARRYLSFGSREMTWLCQTSTHCECEGAEVAGAQWKNRERSLELFLPYRTEKELHKSWRREIVTLYTQRVLGRPSDKLIALSAIATWFEEKLSGTYLAGLWERDLVLDLLWSTEIPSRRVKYKRELGQYYTAPTWSWAACEGWTYYPLTPKNDVDHLTTLISSYISDTPSGPRGTPYHGTIILLGKLAQASLIHDPSAEVPGKGGPFVVEIQNSNQFTSWVVNPDIFPPAHQGYSEILDPYEWHPGELEGRPYPVQVLFLVYYPSGRKVYGILLIRSPERTASYCRVGLAIFRLRESGHIRGLISSWNKEEVTII